MVTLDVQTCLKGQRNQMKKKIEVIRLDYPKINLAHIFILD